jgi:hypothetical protein
LVKYSQTRAIQSTLGESIGINPGANVAKVTPVLILPWLRHAEATLGHFEKRKRLQVAGLR